MSSAPAPAQPAGPSASVAATRCPPALVLPKTPTTRVSWGEGRWARMWEFSTGQRGPVRIAVAHAPSAQGSLSPVVEPPELFDPRDVARGRGVLATLNGDYFEDVPGGAVPTGAVLIDGEVVFAPRGWSRVVAERSSGKLRTTHAAVEGGATIDATSYPVVAVNDPLISRRDIVLFTPRWQLSSVPKGVHAVVIAEGKVTRVATPRSRVSVPEGGVVLATKSARLLRDVVKGARATVDVRLVAKDDRSIVNAAGHGGSVMRKGEVARLCSEYENLRRPRASLAWNDEGEVWMLTSSSGLPDPPDGVRVGGSTKRQLAQVARSLGATDAVILDGGGSVSMFVRDRGKVTRFDLPGGTYVRPIPVLWTLASS